MHYEYDYIVVGGGISGCLVAKRLSLAGNKVTLLESNEQVGGNHRPISFGEVIIDNGLRFLPEGDATRESLKFLESMIGGQIDLTVEENLPLTFAGGEFKPFLGFGEAAPDFYDQLQYYIQEKRLESSIPPHQWCTQILKDSSVKIFNRSIVTQFVMKDGKIDHLLVNGSRPMSAGAYIYAGSLRELIGLLPKDIFSAKQLGRVLKDVYWSALTMDLHHYGHITDLKNMFLLNGTAQDEIGPCVGRFLEPSATGQVSQWLTFVNSEYTEDSEHVVHTLKKMKRQVQRAFPNSLKELRSERIVLSTSIGGGLEYKISDQGQIPQVENLWIASGGAERHINLIGSLQQSQRVCEALLISDKHSSGFLVAHNLSV